MESCGQTGKEAFDTMEILSPQREVGSGNLNCGSKFSTC